MQTLEVLDITRPEKTKYRGRIVKPASSGWMERAVMVGGGLSIVYSFAQAAPIVAAAGVGMVLLHGIKEINNFQSPERSEKLKDLLNSKVVGQPSIEELRKDLQKKYDPNAINKAIEDILDDCEWTEFTAESTHPLKKYGTAYCYQDPHTKEIMLPLEAITRKLQEWGIVPTIATKAEVIKDDQLALQPGSGQGAIASTTTIQDAATSFQGDTSPTFVQSQPEPQTLQELFLRLKDECPEFLRLIKPLPIRLVGKQRTGKSTFARKLVLLRSALIQNHTVAWATPHREVDNPVPEILNPFGTHENGGKNIAAIESVWWAIQEAINQGTMLNTSTVWDEFGSYDQFQFKDELGESLRSLLRESNKHGYFPILVAHGDQASFYPGIKGILTTLKDSTIKVETVGEEADAFGTMRPTGEVEVFWLDGTQSRFKVPEWLTVDLLLKLQPVSIRPALLDNLKTKARGQEIPPEIAARLNAETTNEIAGATPTPHPQTQPQKTEWDEQLEWAIAEIASARAQLEAASMSDKLVEDFNQVAEGELLLPIFESQRHDLLCVVTESIRSGEIKAAKIQSNFHRKPWYKALPQGNGRDRDAVRELFKELAGMGIGQVFGSGDKLSYLLLPHDDRRLSAKQIAEADNETEQETSTVDIREVGKDWLPILENRLAQIENPTAEDVAREAQHPDVLGYPVEGSRLDQLVKVVNDRANVKVS